MADDPRDRHLNHEGQTREPFEERSLPAEEPAAIEGDIPAAQEASFLNLRTLVFAGLGLVAMVVLVHVLAAALFGVFILRNPLVAVRPPALITATPIDPPLQTDPRGDLQRYIKTQEASLNTYGWIDRRAGIVRIPIERAMQILVERGLSAPQDASAEQPTPTPTPAPTSNGLDQLLLPAGFDAGTAGDVASRQTVDDVAFEQRLGQYIPLDLTFFDESGQPLTLSRYFDRKPVILFFAYYECPMLCSIVMNDVATSLQELDFEIGKHYQVVTISMDPQETPDLAGRKKEAILEQYEWQGAADAWRFLTGPQESIASLAEAVGFSYFYDQGKGEFAHPAGIMILTPEGRLSRYLLGIDYSRIDLRLSLVEASANQIGSPADRIFLLCYDYDPVTGTYSLSILKVVRLAGLATVVTLGGVVALLLHRERA